MVLLVLVAVLVVVVVVILLLLLLRQLPAYYAFFQTYAKAQNSTPLDVLLKALPMRTGKQHRIMRTYFMFVGRRMSSAQEGCHQVGMLGPHAFVKYRARSAKARNVC